MCVRASTRACVRGCVCCLPAHTFSRIVAHTCNLAQAYGLQMWKDDFIKWNRSEFNDMDDIVLPRSTIWVPADVGLINRYTLFE